MKAKNQQHFTSDADAKEKLIVYVYEYLIQAGAKQAAEIFKSNIGYTKDIKVSEGPGFLQNWWCVFWDLYCAAPERRHGQPVPTNDAQAFHDFMRQTTPMSPSIVQNSPPQQQLPPQYMGGGAGGPRYGPPPLQLGQRMPMRIQGGPMQHAPPPGGFIPAASPRYVQHSSPAPPPPHMGPVGGPMGFVHGPDQMGPSPGLNRMTPVGAPPPPNGPPPQMVGMSPGPQMGGQPPQPPGQGSPHVNSLQNCGPPPRNGSQGSACGSSGGGWQSSVNYGNVNSPANQQCYSNGPGSNQPSQSGGTMMMNDGGMMELKNSPLTAGGGDPSTPHSADEYVMPSAFGQSATDQCDSAEILKLKQSMQEDNTKMFEKEQSEFGLGEYADSQSKWSQG